MGREVRKVLDCPMCDTPEPSMQSDSAFRFGVVVRLVGALMCLPALFILYVGVSLLWDLLSMLLTSRTEFRSAVEAGSIGILSSLPAVLVGLLFFGVGLLMAGSRKVYRCYGCGYIVERD